MGGAISSVVSAITSVVETVVGVTVSTVEGVLNYVSNIIANPFKLETWASLALVICLAVVSYMMFAYIAEFFSSITPEFLTSIGNSELVAAIRTAWSYVSAASMGVQLGTAFAMYTHNYWTGLVIEAELMPLLTVTLGAVAFAGVDYAAQQARRMEYILYGEYKTLERVPLTALSATHVSNVEMGELGMYGFDQSTLIRLPNRTANTAGPALLFGALLWALGRRS